MSAISSIEWTDRTWNPVRGCSVVSPGCINCYAMKFAHRFSGDGKPYAGLTKQTSSGPQWTGAVQLVAAALTEPLSWRKPSRVFVNSMSDLFHEAIPASFILAVFVTMAKAHRHTFQILTKRAARMEALLTAWQQNGLVLRAGHGAVLPNVWLGVSCEDQQRADERIPHLLRTPAAVRFISAEPLLSGIDLAKHRPGALGLHWVIVGGESGAGARACRAVWIRNLIGQCRDADVPVFVKQLGARPTFDERLEHADWLFAKITDSKGGDVSEWPNDLRVREFPTEAK